MRKYNAENERIKRPYLYFLKEAKGRDQKTLDKVSAALVKFEESTNFKPFKKFNREQTGRFKVYLEKARHHKTGKPLSLTTIDATLRLVKGFFFWLAREPGFKAIISYSDVEYFNNNTKKARAAHAQRPSQYPTMKAALHAFQAMPDGSELEKRNKAIFAFFLLTGARVSAVASLRLKHINLVDGYVFQDGREVDTKFSKTFTTWFFPVDPSYLECFTAWVNYLRNDKLFGQEDALFPKPERRLVQEKFVFDTLSREVYSGTGPINEIQRNAFAMVQLPEYTPHSIRKTLGQELSDLKLPLDAQKAWSQNMGHENFVTTVSAYLHVPERRQGELMRALLKE
ncbi:MAG: site-specific integrase [Rhodobacteraceae bacterium]|nr:site-specific integrase [Paracoccaceae bacterium]